MSNILLGITSSIAIYKAIDLLRLFTKSNWKVKVIMTPSAVNLISPQIFSSLGADGVYWDLFPAFNEGRMENHITLGKWAQLLLIAPCTANTLAKISLGIADNLLTSVALAFSPKKIIVAPAMHTQMYLSPPIQAHVQQLKNRGVIILGPEEGPLASGDKGIGRMISPEEIFSYLSRMV